MLASVKAYVTESINVNALLNQSTVIYPALLSIATGLILSTGTSINPVTIGLISCVSAGGYYLSVKAAQYTIKLAQEIQLAIQQLNSLLTKLNNRTDEAELLLKHAVNTANETQKLIRKLREENVPELTEKFETTVDALTKQIDELKETAQDSMERVTDIAETFRGGVHLNFGQAPALAPRIAVQDEEGRDEPRQEQQARRGRPAINKRGSSTLQ